MLIRLIQWTWLILIKKLTTLLNRCLLQHHNGEYSYSNCAAMTDRYRSDPSWSSTHVGVLELYSWCCPPGTVQHCSPCCCVSGTWISTRFVVKLRYFSACVEGLEVDSAGILYKQEKQWQINQSDHVCSHNCVENPWGTSPCTRFCLINVCKTIVYLYYRLQSPINRCTMFS